jgi:hypothetical protein
MDGLNTPFEDIPHPPASPADFAVPDEAVVIGFDEPGAQPTDETLVPDATPEPPTSDIGIGENVGPELSPDSDAHATGAVALAAETNGWSAAYDGERDDFDYVVQVSEYLQPYERRMEIQDISDRLGGGDIDYDGMIEFEDVPEGAEIERLDTPESFEPYREQFEAIQEQLDAGVPPEAIPNHVATGGLSSVFATEDGKLMKLPTVPTPHEHDIDTPPEPAIIHTDYVVPLERAQGGETLEQMVTFTEEGIGCAVVETAPGQTIGNTAESVIHAVPRDHQDQLMRGFKEMESRNLYPDIDNENMLYDPQAAYTNIDFGAIEYTTIQPPFTAVRMMQDCGIGMLFDAPGRIGDAVSEGMRNYYEAARDAFSTADADVLLDGWQRAGWNVTAIRR